MKTRNKSTHVKQNIIMQAKKSHKHQHNSSSMANISMNNVSKNSKSLANKKIQNQIKNNLESTLKLLQGRLNLSKTQQQHKQRKSSLLTISQQIYKIVKQNIPEKGFTNTLKSQAPTMNSFTNSSNDLLNKKRSQSNNSNYSSTQVMDYFKDKFGSPAHDEETMEKKLRVIQALKRTQQLATKSKGNSNYNSSMHSAYDIGGKDMVVGKIKEKCRKA